jgi:hypothetical protein
LISYNSTVRNTFYFNRTNPIFGADYTYSETGSKTLLANGYDARKLTYHTINTRWNIKRKFTLKLAGETGVKRSAVDYTTGRNYEITYQKIQPELLFQPSTKFRLSLSGRYEEKTNSNEWGGENAYIGDIGLSARWNQPEKGSFNANFKFISIRYNGTSNNTVAYEMLESLKSGNNFTWNIGYQRSLSKNLQINIQYNGRRSENSKTVHAGGVEVRVFF